MFKDFEKIQPFYKITPDYILNKKGHYAVSFQLMLPEIYTLSEQEIYELNDVLYSGLSYF